jgi:hypothetical protein
MIQQEEDNGFMELDRDWSSCYFDYSAFCDPKPK